MQLIRLKVHMTTNEKLVKNRAKLVLAVFKYYQFEVRLQVSYVPNINEIGEMLYI